MLCCRFSHVQLFGFCRLLPTRLLCPWDSLGKNTRVGCHLYLTLCNAMDCCHQALLSIGFSRQEYGVGCHALLQGIFLTQGSNPHLRHLLHWQVGSLPLVPPAKLEQEQLHFLRETDHFVSVMLSPLPRYSHSCSYSYSFCRCQRLPLKARKWMKVL